VINEDLTGICEQNSYYLDPEKLYPGETCSDTQYWKVCGYGSQKCYLF
jgi:hypothetical protein